jgi:SHS2 domain-containing protein
MPYRYLDDIATADVAFIAWGNCREELFSAAADALMNVMVADLATIQRRETVVIDLEEVDLDLLLFSFLQELIFFKDARQLLLRVESVALVPVVGGIQVKATVTGERIAPERHSLLVDVKAVTFHRFRVGQTPDGWEAEVILDI